MSDKFRFFYPLPNPPPKKMTMITISIVFRGRNEERMVRQLFCLTMRDLV